jgi:beta-1,4-mannosyltransferase
MTITAPRSDQTAPSDGPDGSAVLVAAGVGSERVNIGLHAQQNVVVEAQVLPASDTHTATGFGALSDVTDDFVRLADVLATLTAANYSQGAAATIETLRPAELLPPVVRYPWTEPQTLTTPGLPAALRRIPTHAIQLKRRLARRHTPKANFLVFFLLFVSILVVFARITSDQRTPFNYLLSVVWSVYAPLIVLGLIGALSLRRQQRRGRRSAGKDASDVPMTSATDVKLRRERNKPLRSEYTGRSSRLLVVTVPSLLAKGNQPALERVLHSLLLNLPVYFDRFHLDVITEGDVDVQPLQDWIKRCGRMGEPIRIVNVPSDYSTPLGARFKTRANQFAMEARREAGENTEDCYVYHLDDDTHIGRDTAASLAEFIELDGDHFYLAQGILTFPHELTPSKFCRLADSIRPADDLTRFSFFTGVMGTPLGGLHGEHLVIRADIEDEIGWDFPDTVVEDAYFAIQFATKYPKRSTTLNSYSYGASPSSVRDLLRQRRRWIEGLLHLAFNRRLPLVPKLPLLYSIFTWSLAPIQFVGLALLISYATGIDNTSPVSSLFLPLWAISLAGVFWFYLEGLKINLSASDRPRPHLLFSLVIIPGIYLITVIETIGVVLGIVRFMGFGSQKVSEVITKPI